MSPFRYLDVFQQLLHRQSITQVVAHGVEVVQPIGVGHIHQPAIALADLLVVAVQVAHHRFHIDHRLAVQGDNHTEDAVGAGVLRTYIDHDFLGAQASSWQVAGVHDGQRLFGRRPFVGIPLRWVDHVSAKARLCLGLCMLPTRPATVEGLGGFFVIGLFVVLAHGMAVKALPQQDALEVGMPWETDPVQIPDLAFLQISAGPDGGQRGHLWVLFRHAGLEDQGTTAPAGGVQVIDHLEAGITSLIVHAGDVGEQIVGQVFRVAQVLAHLDQP